MPSTSGLVSADVVTWRPKPTKSNTPLGIKVSQGLGVGVVTGASCATAKQARTNRIRTVVTAGCNERWIRLSIGRVVAFSCRLILSRRFLSTFVFLPYEFLLFSAAIRRDAGQFSKLWSSQLCCRMALQLDDKMLSLCHDTLPALVYDY